jgi:hypothetical protein
VSGCCLRINSTGMGLGVSERRAGVTAPKSASIIARMFY